MTDQVQTDEQTNGADIASLGTRAIEYLRSSERDGAKAGGMAIYCLFQAWHSVIFNAKVTDKNGHTVEQESFTLAEYVNPDNVPYNENNTKNIKLMAARTIAVMSRVFGITEPNAAEKQLLIRSLPVVQYLARMDYDLTDVTLSKRNNLCVPFEAMNAAPDASKATANELKRYDAMIGESWEIDGKGGNSLAQLSRMATPKKERASQAASSDADKGASFVASAKLVTACVQRLMNEDAEDDMPSPNEDARVALFDLMITLTGYFAADPLGTVEDQEAAIEEAKAKANA